MLKKIIGGLILAFAFLLSGCGGDNGELAGTYIEKNPQSEYPVKWIITYDKKDNYYTQEVFRKYSPNNDYSRTNKNSFLTRNDNWVGGKEKHFIRVIDKNTLQFRDDENDVYVRVN